MKHRGLEESDVYINLIKNNNISEITETPSDKKEFLVKWIYTVKTDENGHIQKLK